MPMVLISTGFATMVPSLDIDAACYTSSLDDAMARVIAILFRDLLPMQPYPTNDRRGYYAAEGPRPFVVERR